MPKRDKLFTKKDANTAQMFDAGWDVRMSKGGMGSYYCEAAHDDEERMARVRAFWRSYILSLNPEMAEFYEDDWALETDHHSPSEALYALSYKVRMDPTYLERHDEGAHDDDE
jgi:hypothetical protein